METKKINKEILIEQLDTVTDAYRLTAGYTATQPIIEQYKQEKEQTK